MGIFLEKLGESLTEAPCVPRVGAKVGHTPYLQPTSILSPLLTLTLTTMTLFVHAMYVQMRDS